MPSAPNAFIALLNLGDLSGSLNLQSVKMVQFISGCIKMMPPAHSVSSSGCATMTAHLESFIVRFKKTSMVNPVPFKLLQDI